MAERDDVVVCDACPVLCRIRDGRAGACARYANLEGVLTRVDPVVMASKVAQDQGEMVPFLTGAGDWDGNLVPQAGTFLTGIGSGTTYPDYKPAPFIVSSSCPRSFNAYFDQSPAKPAAASVRALKGTFATALYCTLSI